MAWYGALSKWTETTTTWATAGRQEPRATLLAGAHSVLLSELEAPGAAKDAPRWSNVAWGHPPTLSIRQLVSRAFELPVDALGDELKCSNGGILKANAAEFDAAWAHFKNNYGLYSTTPVPRVRGHRYALLPRETYTDGVAHSPVPPACALPIAPAGIGLKLSNFTGTLDVFLADTVHVFVAKHPGAAMSESAHEAHALPSSMMAVSASAAATQGPILMTSIELPGEVREAPMVQYAASNPAAVTYSIMDDVLVASHVDADLELKMRGASYSLTGTNINAVIFIKPHESLTAITMASASGSVRAYGQYDLENDAVVALAAAGSVPHTDAQFAALVERRNAEATVLRERLVGHFTASPLPRHYEVATQALRTWVHVDLVAGNVTLDGKRLLSMRRTLVGTTGLTGFVLFDTELVDAASVLPLGLITILPEPWHPGTLPFDLSPYAFSDEVGPRKFFEIMDEPDPHARCMALDTLFGYAALSIGSLDHELAAALRSFALSPAPTPGPAFGAFDNEIVLEEHYVGGHPLHQEETPSALYVPPHMELVAPPLASGDAGKREPTSGPVSPSEADAPPVGGIGGDIVEHIEFEFDPSVLPGMELPAPVPAPVPVPEPVPAPEPESAAQLFTMDAIHQASAEEAEQTTEALRPRRLWPITVKRPKDATGPAHWPFNPFDANKAMIHYYAEAAVEQLADPSGPFSAIEAINLQTDMARATALLVSSIPKPQAPGRPPGALNKHPTREDMREMERAKAHRSALNSKRICLILDLVELIREATASETIDRIGAQAKVVADQLIEQEKQRRNRMRLEKKSKAGKHTSKKRSAPEESPHDATGSKPRHKKAKLQPQQAPLVQPTVFAEGLGLGNIEETTQQLLCAPTGDDVDAMLGDMFGGAEDSEGGRASPFDMPSDASITPSHPNDPYGYFLHVDAQRRIPDLLPEVPGLGHIAHGIMPEPPADAYLNLDGPEFY